MSVTMNRHQPRGLMVNQQQYNSYHQQSSLNQNMNNLNSNVVQNNMNVESIMNGNTNYMANMNNMNSQMSSLNVGMYHSINNQNNDIPYKRNIYKVPYDSYSNMNTNIYQQQMQSPQPQSMQNQQSQSPINHMNIPMSVNHRQSQNTMDSTSAPSASDLDNTNLYIKGLRKNCSQVELDDLFKNFGVICQSRVYGDGVGFVRFETGSEATKAIAHMNGKKPDGSTELLLVKRAFKKVRINKRYVRVGEDEVEMIMNKNTNNVYLRCLPNGFSEQDLIDLCSPYGELTCTRLRESGVAFVRYRSPDDALNAIREMNGKPFDNQSEKLLAKLANSDPFQPKIGFQPKKFGYGNDDSSTDDVSQDREQGELIPQIQNQPPVHYQYINNTYDVRDNVNDVHNQRTYDTIRDNFPQKRKDITPPTGYGHYDNRGNFHQYNKQYSPYKANMNMHQQQYNQQMQMLFQQQNGNQYSMQQSPVGSYPAMYNYPSPSPTHQWSNHFINGNNFDQQMMQQQQMHNKTLNTNTNTSTITTNTATTNIMSNMNSNVMYIPTFCTESQRTPSYNMYSTPQTYQGGWSIPTGTGNQLASPISKQRRQNMVDNVQPFQTINVPNAIIINNAHEDTTVVDSISRIDCIEPKNEQLIDITDASNNENKPVLTLDNSSNDMVIIANVNQKNAINLLKINTNENLNVIDNGSNGLNDVLTPMPTPTPTPTPDAIGLIQNDIIGNHINIGKVKNVEMLSGKMSPSPSTQTLLTIVQNTGKRKKKEIHSQMYENVISPPISDVGVGLFSGVKSFANVTKSSNVISPGSMDDDTIIYDKKNENKTPIISTNTIVNSSGISSEANPYHVEKAITDKIYALIQKWYPNKGPKLTGMFLSEHNQNSCERYLANIQILQQKMSIYDNILIVNSNKSSATVVINDILDTKKTIEEFNVENSAEL